MCKGLAEIIQQWSPIISSVVMIGLTFWLGYLTMILARETRLTRERNESADVQVALRPHASSAHQVILEIANVGAATARQISTMIKSIDFYGNAREDILNITVLLPGARFPIYVGFYSQLNKQPYEINLSFQDTYGLHHLNFTQDLSSWTGIPRTAENPAYDVANALKEISQTLESLTSGSKQLSVNFSPDQDQAHNRNGLEEQSRP